jgi:hypothetical protein
MWVDTICNSRFDNSLAYRVIFILVIIVEIPWVAMVSDQTLNYHSWGMPTFLYQGWIAIRKEHHAWSLAFLVSGLAIVAAWSSMFASILYQWTFQNFPFFATVTVTAFIVLVITVALGIICRLNFGHGLPKYRTSFSSITALYTHGVCSHNRGSL